MEKKNRPLLADTKKKKKEEEKISASFSVIVTSFIKSQKYRFMFFTKMFSHKVLCVDQIKLTYISDIRTCFLFLSESLST